MKKIYIIIGEEIASKEVESDFEVALESLKGMSYDYLIHIDEDSVINIYDAINGDHICDPSISEEIINELEEIITIFAQSSDYDNDNIEEFIAEYSGQIESIHERHIQEIQNENPVMSTVQEILTDYVSNKISKPKVNPIKSLLDGMLDTSDNEEYTPNFVDDNVDDELVENQEAAIFIEANPDWDTVYEDYNGSEFNLDSENYKNFIAYIAQQISDGNNDREEHVEQYLMAIDVDYIIELEDIVEIVDEELDSIGLYNKD